ncbi:MAG: hypothetical protein AAF307_09345 [Pseudomonadota bacterium]
MNFWRAIALLAFFPSAAVALSCAAPDAARSFARYDAADETYVVVRGAVTLEEAALPRGQTGGQEPPRLTRVMGRLRGLSLTKGGFDRPFSQDLTLEVRCIGPWCGSLRDGEDVLAFVRKAAEGYALEVNPCGGEVLVAPTPQVLDAVRRCFETRACAGP